jgi:hypothetical protein
MRPSRREAADDYQPGAKRRSFVSLVRTHSISSTPAHDPQQQPQQQCSESRPSPRGARTTAQFQGRSKYPLFRSSASPRSVCAAATSMHAWSGVALAAGAPPPLPPPPPPYSSRSRIAPAAPLLCPIRTGSAPLLLLLLRQAVPDEGLPDRLRDVHEGAFRGLLGEPGVPIAAGDGGASHARDQNYFHFW